MPPAVALFLSFIFIGFLLWRDSKAKPNVTGALWLPTLWILIIGSRPISGWLNLSSPSEAVAFEDGSPIDRLVMLVQIIAGLLILSRRGVSIQQLARDNRWLFIYLLYCLVSVAWSDFPFVALKRWIKILGHPIMVLIILTEPNPLEALANVMKRCAYFLIPISVVFIKYFPELGRGYSPWTGRAFYTGITTDKNAMGYLCMAFGFFFVWHLVQNVRGYAEPLRRKEKLLNYFFLGLILWIFKLIDAKTALVTTCVSVATTIMLGTRFLKKQYIGSYLLALVTMLFCLEMMLGVYEKTIRFLGRDPTLTDRTEVWSEVLKLDKNPILGEGFESFWLGERLEILWDIYWWKPNQAHNGYIETYLNLGIVGLVIWIILIVSIFFKIKRQLFTDFAFGRFRLPLLLALLLFAYTDAFLKALHPLFFVFFLISIELPRARAVALSEASKFPNVSNRFTATLG